MSATLEPGLTAPPAEAAPPPVVRRRQTARLPWLAQPIGLALILALALFLRAYNLDWDAGQHQHPDERFMTEVAMKVRSPSSVLAYFDSARSTLNPYAQGFNQYAYGQLPLTITTVAAEKLNMTGYDSVYMVGRALSVLAEVGTVLFTWLLARRIFGVRHAYLSALLLTLSVLPIQLAHYFAVDTFATFFAAATLYWGQRAWQRESLLDAALAGLMAGAATASKISAATLLPVLFVAFLWPRSRRPWRDQLLDSLTLFGVAVLCTFAAFRIAEPYAFLGPTPLNVRPNPQWFSDKVYWADVSSGGVDVPYMIQWAGTTPYLFVLRSIFLWGMGPALATAALAGAALAAWRLFRGRPGSRESLLLVTWVALNLGYFGGQFAKFMRYLLPTYFALAILAAFALLFLYDLVRTRKRLRLAAAGLVAVVVLATAGCAVAFDSIYSEPHSRIQASNWIYDNIPAGKTLATEHWDDRLPLNVDKRDGRIYRYVEMPLYDPETPEKRAKVEQALDQSDYVILASRRLIDSIPKLPERYPMATAYYQYLESGQLGFERVDLTRVTPHLGPISFDDSRAQEDFTVYDHPSVEVWVKRPDYSSQSVHALLDGISLDQVVNVKPINAGKGNLLLSPVERQAATNGGTWSQLFDRNGLPNQLPVPVWLLVSEALALSAVPLLWWMLRFLPDGGFGASKVVALAIVAYLAWLPASFRLVPFGRASLMGAWLLVLLGSALVVWRKRGALGAWLRRERWLLASVEAVFLLGTLLFLLIRAANPDLWHPSFGGEKPMNFAYLNAVVKSDYFPPYDPWFAGGYINYYYFGFVLVAALIKLTGIMPEIAFNLAQPTLFGAVCAGAFSLAFALALPARRWVRRGTAYLAGVAAVLLLAVLGNLDAGIQLVEQVSKLGAQQAPQSTGFLRILAGLSAIVQGSRIPPLDFWRSTRFIGPEDPGPIHEFPYFTYLYGDLHAHQIALPITIAVLLVGVSLLRSARLSPGRVAWPAVGLGALLVGMLRAANTWDFPTYAALAVAVLAIGYLPALVHLNRRAFVALGASAVALLVASQALFLPYLQHYQLFYTGVDPTKAKTDLLQYLTIHGLFWLLGGSLLAYYAVRAWRRLALESRRSSLVPQPEPGYYGLLVPAPAALAEWAPSSLPAWLVAGGVLLAAISWLGGYPTRAAIVLAMAAATAAAAANWRRGSRMLQATLVAAGLFATLIPEVVTLQGDVGRMNTVFKFYFQAWTLLAIGGAVALAYLVQRVGREALLRALRPAWIVVLALLVGAATSYPLFATEGKVGLRFAQIPSTLDGMAYMDQAHYEDRGRDLNLPADAAAIRWMQDNVVGSPVVLEGRSPLYHWGSRVSIYTGLPTVLGWDWHEIQQRTAYERMIQERAQDVQRVYESPNAADALAVIQKYQVRWVYVGGLERAYYPPAGLEKFRTMPSLRLAYDHDGVQIYEVTP